MMCFKSQNSPRGRVPVADLREPTFVTTKKEHNDVNAQPSTIALLPALNLLPETSQTLEAELGTPQPRRLHSQVHNP